MKKVIARLLSRRRVSSSNSSIPLSNGSPSAIESRKKKNPWGLLIAIGFVVLGILAGQYVLSRKTPSTKGTVSPLVSNPARTQTVPINRSFEFNAFDSSKKKSNKKVIYTLTEAEKTTQIIIKGKPATAVSGRAFLIISLKLTNDRDESLYLNTRNYIRIQPEGTSDKLAAEIHNDTVEIQPLSTKITRIGVPVDSAINAFTLYVGEVEVADKEQIQINF